MELSPIVIGLEASGLCGYSYPISVAWGSHQDDIEYHIICPEPDWLEHGDWDERAERVHGFHDRQVGNGGAVNQLSTKYVERLQIRSYLRIMGGHGGVLHSLFSDKWLDELSLEHLLLICAHQHWRKDLARLLRAGVNPNFTMQATMRGWRPAVRSWSPLGLALERWHTAFKFVESLGCKIEAVAILLAYGADPNLNHLFVTKLLGGDFAAARVLALSCSTETLNEVLEQALASQWGDHQAINNLLSEIAIERVRSRGEEASHSVLGL